MDINPELLNIGQYYYVDTVTDGSFVELTAENIVQYKNGLYKIKRIPLNERWLYDLNYRKLLSGLARDKHMVIVTSKEIICTNTGLVLKYVDEIQRLYSIFNNKQLKLRK